MHEMPTPPMKMLAANTSNHPTWARLRTSSAAAEPRVLTTKESNRSAGLGLSQVYGFAIQSRGAAGAKSETGKGTEITMHLPRTIAAPLEDRMDDVRDHMWQLEKEGELGEAFVHWFERHVE